MTITENKESLEVIRFKCAKRQTDFNAEELRHLNLVYTEINDKLGKQKRPLDQSCGSCVITAMNMVHNYIVYHEVKKGSKYITMKSVEESKPTVTELSLKELREQYPHIKATSVEVFLQKLNETE